MAECGDAACVVARVAPPKASWTWAYYQPVIALALGLCTGYLGYTVMHQAVHRAADQVRVLQAGVGAVVEVVLVLDPAGVIVDLSCRGETPANLLLADWIGQRWVDTVALESRPKIEQLLGQTHATAPGQPGKPEVMRWRHVNHALPDNQEWPVSYTLVSIDRDTVGRSEGPWRMAFGHDLRNQITLQQRLVTAQLSMERDYWRLRQVETRYRLLFQMASEPVLILAGAMDRLAEANPAAYELFGERMRTPSWSLTDSLEEHSATALRDMIERLRVSGRADPCSVRLRDGTEDMLVAASQFRQDNQQHFLLRFTRPLDSMAPALAAGRQQLLQVIDGAPDAVVVTDLDGRILAWNLRQPALVAMFMSLLRRHPRLAPFVLARFSPRTAPDDPAVVQAIEKALG